MINDNLKMIPDMDMILSGLELSSTLMRLYGAQAYLFQRQYLQSNRMNPLLLIANGVATIYSKGIPQSARAVRNHPRDFRGTDMDQLVDTITTKQLIRCSNNITMNHRLVFDFCCRVRNLNDDVVGVRLHNRSMVVIHIMNLIRPMIKVRVASPYRSYFVVTANTRAFIQVPVILMTGNRRLLTTPNRKHKVLDRQVDTILQITMDTTTTTRKSSCLCFVPVTYIFLLLFRNVIFRIKIRPSTTKLRWPFRHV